MPEFRVEIRRGTRPATALEVRERFGVGRPDRQGSDPMADENGGYFRIEPGGQLLLICQLPWRFEMPGGYQVQCAIHRYDPLSNTERPFDDAMMTCPPLILDVVGKEN